MEINAKIGTDRKKHLKFLFNIMSFEYSFVGIGKKCNQVWAYSNQTKGGGSSATLMLCNNFPHITKVLTVPMVQKALKRFLEDKFTNIWKVHSNTPGNSQGGVLGQILLCSCFIILPLAPGQTGEKARQNCRHQSHENPGTLQSDKPVK